MCGRKAVFLDMDGTLCVAHSKPGEKTVEAIKRAQRNGHKVFLCTGRAEGLIPQFISDLQLDGIISGSGAYATVGGTPIIDIPFPKDTITQLLDVFGTHGIIIMLGTADNVYIDLKSVFRLNIPEIPGINSEMVNLNNMARSGVMTDISRFSEDIGVYNILFFADAENQLPEYREWLDSMHLTSIIHPADIPGTITNIELTRKDINKGSALETVCEYIGIPVCDSISFGDSMNDYEMLKASGIGIAMGNGDDEIKSYADRICGTVEEEGICDAFIDLELI